MPAICDAGVATKPRLGRPHHHMRRARPDQLITARTAVLLDRAAASHCPDDPATVLLDVAAAVRSGDWVGRPDMLTPAASVGHRDLGNYPSIGNGRPTVYGRRTRSHPAKRHRGVILDP